MNEELIERFASIVEPMQKLDLGLTAISGILHGKLAGGQNTLFEIGILKSVESAFKDVFQSLRELLIYEIDNSRNEFINNSEAVTVNLLKRISRRYYNE